MPISSRRSLSIMWNLKLGMAKIEGNSSHTLPLFKNSSKLENLRKEKPSVRHSGQTPTNIAPETLD